jgi:hypothetical protein
VYARENKRYPVLLLPWTNVLWLRDWCIWEVVGDDNNITRVHGSCTSHGVAGAANRLSQGTEFANDHNADRCVDYLHLHLPTRSRGHDAFSAFRVACPKWHFASSWEVMLVARSAKQVPEVSLMLSPGLVVRNLTYYAWCMYLLAVCKMQFALFQAFSCQALDAGLQCMPCQANCIPRQIEIHHESRRAQSTGPVAWLIVVPPG